MKKWIGTICSAVASILTFIFLALPAWAIKPIMGETVSFNGYKLIGGKYEGEKLFAKDSFLESSPWNLYRVFAIILIVLAVLLALYAVFTLLVNLNVVKVSGDWINIVNCALITLTFVVAVVALISALRIDNGILSTWKKLDANMTMKDLKTALGEMSVKAGLWLVAIANLLSAGCAWTFHFLGKKSK